METDIHFWSYLGQFLLGWKIFQTKVVEKIKRKSMAMCGNYMQRVKIVINDNIIEQVTDFKYLGYRTLE